ncbi:MAG: hypothetical protein QNJ16_01930 [Rhodobacter sp.]|nr:hypothetical protein [Rhodobacter sp.]
MLPEGGGCQTGRAFDRRGGVVKGIFRLDLDPLEQHWKISAICVFNACNQATFSHLFCGNLFTDKGQEELRQRLTSIVLDVVRRP